MNILSVIFVVFHVIFFQSALPRGADDNDRHRENSDWKNSLEPVAQVSYNRYKNQIQK